MDRSKTEISPAELERQREYMARVAEINAASPRQPLAFVDTYGCQQNEADSEHCRGMLREMGYGFTEDEKEADVIVINTCAVREHAENRILGNVGALVHTKRAKPGQLIAVCGCMVQQKQVVERIKKSFVHVNLVFGPSCLWRFPEYLFMLLRGKKRIFAEGGDEATIAEGLPVVRRSALKAWLPIAYGCNNFCSYCIVPYVRGRERSRLPEAIIAEAKDIIAGGGKDITLLGQNVNSYGRGLEGDWNFARLMREINSLDGEFLIRFMTSHPKDATEELFETMARSEKAARHLHLPFQAGNNDILRKMNRGYTAESYLKLIEKVRSYIPDIVLTSDVIVGFPNETEAEFEDTLRLVEQVRFDSLFTFIYSKRGGTPAAEMPDGVSHAEKVARFDRLIELQTKISEEKHAAMVGKTVTALVDEIRDEELNLTARTSGNRLIHLKGDPALLGRFIPVKITDSRYWGLFGAPAEERS